jgi:hypothetical protein
LGIANPLDGPDPDADPIELFEPDQWLHRGDAERFHPLWLPFGHFGARSGGADLPLQLGPCDTEEVGGSA